MKIVANFEVTFVSFDSLTILGTGASAGTGMTKLPMYTMRQK